MGKICLPLVPCMRGCSDAQGTEHTPARLPSLPIHGPQAPTLLIVGGEDTSVLELNHMALARLPHGKLQVMSRF